MTKMPWKNCSSAPLIKNHFRIQSVWDLASCLCQRHFSASSGGGLRRRDGLGTGRWGFTCRSGLGRIVSFAFEVNVKLREGDFDIMFGEIPCQWSLRISEQVTAPSSKSLTQKRRRKSGELAAKSAKLTAGTGYLSTLSRPLAIVTRSDYFFRI